MYALEPALYEFQSWGILGMAVLLLSAAGIYLVVSALLSLCPPAWAAWISIALGVIGVLMGIGLFVHAVANAADAWQNFDRALRTATTHSELDRAGRTFGREMATAVVEIFGAVMSVIAGSRGIFGGLRGLGILAPPPNSPIPGAGSGAPVSPQTVPPPPARAAPPPPPPPSTRAIPPPPRLRGVPLSPPQPARGTPPSPRAQPAAEPPVPESPIAAPSTPEAPVAESPPPRVGGRMIGGRMSLTREAMHRLLQQIWEQAPLLQRLAAARELSGAELVTELRAILQAFQAETGVIVEEVANGVVQAVRGTGNLASLRSSPGRLQIEARVFEDPQLLLTEVTHELDYYYLRLATGSPPLLGDGPLSALELLDMVIEEGGNVAQVVR